MAIQISGKLDTKQLAHYLKKSRKDHTIRVYRGEDGLLLIADGLLLVQAMVTADLAEFTPPVPGLWGYFSDGSGPLKIDSPDLLAFWQKSHTHPVIAPLNATHLLWEETHWKKPSTLFRKMRYEGNREVWIDRAFLDCFEVDPDDLTRQFILELVQDKHSRMVRVSCAYGITAYLMPAQNIPEA